MPTRRPRALYALAGSGALVATSFPGAAHAFCREVTVATPAGYDPALTGCFAPTSNPQTGGGAFALYWNNQCVGYSLDQRASAQVSLDQATSVAAKAFAAWSASACPSGGSPSIAAVDEGPVACGQVQFNKNQGNQHVITFRDDGWPYDDSANTLGLTTLTVRLSTGEIYDADMEINSHDFAFSLDGSLPAGTASDGGLETVDLLGVMTHEAGHFLGLAHSDDQGAVMYAFYTPGLGSLAADDVAGICAIDLPDGERATSTGNVAAGACDPTPIHGFSTQCASDVPGVDAGAPGAAPTPARAHGCALARTRGGGDLEFGLLCVVGVGAVSRRRRLRGAIASVGIALAALGVSAPWTGDAQASVSIAVLFDELVRTASAVAVATPVEQHGQWENGRIVTYTRAHVDAVVAGQLPSEVVVRTMGGAVEDIGQIVDGEATLALGRPSLLFLRPRVESGLGAPPGEFAVVARAQGQFAIVVGEDKTARLRAAGAGGLVAPSSARVARATAGRSFDYPTQLARDVLHDRPFDDAARVIATAWAARHASPK
jgi:Matrixin